MYKSLTVWFIPNVIFCAGQQKLYLIVIEQINVILLLTIGETSMDGFW